MSTSRTVQYHCPYCGKTFETEIYESIDAVNDRDLRDRCVSGDLFRVSCPHCKQEYMIQFPVVYIDQEHKFILWVSDTNTPESIRKFGEPLVKKGYQLRRCPTLKEFAEKIQILEDGVDDRMVELAKYDCFIEFIDNKKGNPEDVTGIEYQRTENGVMKINVRTNDKGMSFLIPLTMVEEEMESEADLYEIDNWSFPVINSAWITSLFTEPDGMA